MYCTVRTTVHTIPLCLSCSSSKRKMFQSVLYGKRYKPKELIDADKRQKKYNSNRALENEALKFRLPLITGSYPKIKLLPQKWATIRLNGYESGSRETPSKPIAVVTEGYIACIY